VADPVASHVANTDGTLSVLEASRRAGGPHLVVASSSSVYGANPILPKREDLVAMPRSPYAATKLAAESYSLAWQETYGIPVLAFRFFNVFGPLQPPGHAYAAVVPAFVSAALEGRPIPIHGDGRQSRDFTYVGTVVEVLATAVAERVSSPTPVNLAFGTRVDLLAVVALLEELLGRSLPVDHQELRAGDVRDSQADGTRLRALFPAVDPVGLTEGLRATIDWMASTLG
jgi:UDP-glucose 4-epimerase